MIVVRVANLQDPGDVAQIVDLVDLYAQDPMGQGRALGDAVRHDLAVMLATHPGALAFLAEEHGVPMGVANCFLGMSSFTGAPVLNIHDLAVRAERRGRGVGRAMIAFVEEHARAIGCSRVTLEVSASNAAAQALYRSCGFAGVGPDADSVTYACLKPLV